MKSTIAKYSIVFAAGLLLGLILISPSKEYTVSSKTDTVYVPKPYPKIVTVTGKVPDPITIIEVPKYIHVKAPIPHWVDSTEDKKNYLDTLQVEPDFQLTYDVWTTGTLDKITLGYIDTRPERIVTTTITKTRPPKGIYIGGTISTIPHATADLYYLNNRNLFGAGYGYSFIERRRVVEVKYARRLF